MDLGNKAGRAGLSNRNFLESARGCGKEKEALGARREPLKGLQDKAMLLVILSRIFGALWLPKKGQSFPTHLLPFSFPLPPYLGMGMKLA